MLTLSALTHMKPDRRRIVASKQKPTGASLLHGGQEAHDERIGTRGAGEGQMEGVPPLREEGQVEDSRRVRSGYGCGKEDGDLLVEESAADQSQAQGAAGKAIRPGRSGSARVGVGSLRLHLLEAAR